MAFGYRSGGRYSRNGFCSSRGNRGSSFRGRGHGSDSYFSSSNRDSYSDRSSHRGSSYRETSFRVKEDNYDSRGSGTRYHNDRYSGSHGHRDDNFHHKDMRESASGSYGREYSRRNDVEPERKRIRSEIGISYKEGVSPRKSYDELDRSSRSFNSNNSSPYHSDTSPFGKSHRKEFSEFKKPLPPEHSYSCRRIVRSSRGRGGSARSGMNRTVKPSAPPFVKRSGVNRISRLKTASRLHQILRKKKQIRIMRMRKERETRLRILASGSSKDKLIENNIMSSEEELDGDEEMEIAQQIKEEQMENMKHDKELNPEKKEFKKVLKKIKKESRSSSAEKVTLQNESLTKKEKEKVSSVKGLRKDYIQLKCIHCETEYKTFKSYHHHLASYKHKLAMEKLLHEMKQKLRRMRTEQREQQRMIDEQSDDFAKTSYCKLCKLNYKQTKQEHYTSDFHINMNEFLNSRCTVCRISFGTPILYEHHRCTLAHIKRKSFLEKKGVLIKDGSNDEDNNDDDNFMVLDSVGSADESNDESVLITNESNDIVNEKNASIVMKKRIPKVIGGEFIKRVSVYYCKLCRLCISYNPNRDLEESLLTHCRGRFHLKRFSMEKLKKPITSNKEVKRKAVDKIKSENENSDNTNNSHNDEINEKFWTNETAVDDHKSSEDEDDFQPSNRYDRFGTSDEKDNVEKQKTEFEKSDNQNEEEIDNQPTSATSGT